MEGLTAEDREVLGVADEYFRKAWWRSREARAYLMLMNRWEWTTSDDWCEVFGCCGHGWDDQDDEQAIGELRAAHLFAGLPVPDWISKPSDHPPRRRSHTVVISELTARVKELEGARGRRRVLTRRW